MNKKAILVVDDEADFVDLVRTTLEAKGYDIIAAYDGKDALEKASKEKPDLILLDLVMPRPNGFEVLSKLKSSWRTANIPIIILTAKGDKDYILDAQKLGAADYMVKPISLEHLVELVGKHI